MGRPRKHPLPVPAENPLNETQRDARPFFEAGEPPAKEWNRGDLTPAYVLWMFQTDENAARAHYADRLHTIEVREVMEELGLA